MNEKGSLPSAPAPGQTMPGAPPPYSPYPSLPAEPVGPPPVNPTYHNPTYQVGLTQPVPQAPPTTVVQVVQAPAKLTALGPDSVRLACLHCQADINTRVDKDPSIVAYISAVFLFLFGCVCGCCLIPFCIDSCKTSEHYCPNCKRFIGRYSRY